MGGGIMPQITVTLADDVYWDLQNLPKGLKSKFVNEALKSAVLKCLDDTARGTVCPARMHALARGRLGSYDASMHPSQEKLGVEEE
tara:strand:+ start:14 stop:271 length:258 start_codon:yes stop_codon:yes gene_type:complete